MEYWKYLFMGLILSWGGTLTALNIFPSLGLLDFPERYGLKRNRIPYPGGLIFWILSFCFVYLDKPLSFTKI